VSTNKLSGHFGRCGFEVPRQQFGDAVDGMVGDTGQHLAQIGFRIEAIELGRTDQAVDRGSTFPTRVGRQFIVPGFWLTK
jgi:hypothetical protein